MVVRLTPVDFDPFTEGDAQALDLAGAVTGKPTVLGAIGQAVGTVAGEKLQSLYDMATYPFHHPYPPSFADQDDPRTQAAIGNAANIGLGLELGGAMRAPAPGAGVELGTVMPGPFFHGSPERGLNILKESTRGPLGEGVYSTPAEQIAGHYAGPEGKIYEIDTKGQGRDIYQGMGHRTDAEYHAWKDDKRRLLEAAEPDKKEAVGALLDKMWASDGYPLFHELSRLYGSQDRAQALFQKAGFEGISGQVDGPEVLMFGEQRVKPSDELNPLKRDKHSSLAELPHMAGDVVPMSMRVKGFNDYMEGKMDPPGDAVSNDLYKQGRIDAGRKKLQDLRIKRIGPDESSLDKRQKFAMRTDVASDVDWLRNTETPATTDFRTGQTAWDTRFEARNPAAAGMIDRAQRLESRQKAEQQPPKPGTALEERMSLEQKRALQAVLNAWGLVASQRDLGIEKLLGASEAQEIEDTFFANGKKYKLTPIDYDPFAYGNISP
jgi:hypothetical protein